MQSQWRIFFNTKTEDKASKLLSQVQEQIGLLFDGTSIEKYHKGGYVANCTLTQYSGGWNDCVAEVIEYGQRVSYDWLLTGDVRNALDGWSNKSSIPGISAIGWSITKSTEDTSDD